MTEEERDVIARQKIESLVGVDYDYEPFSKWFGMIHKDVKPGETRIEFMLRYVEDYLDVMAHS